VNTVTGSGVEKESQSFIASLVSKTTVISLKHERDGHDLARSFAHKIYSGA
jgi:hypothetical protein